MAAPLKVLIVGGGIAGPALAYWLSRLSNFHVTLLERASCIRATGQQIDLRAQGVPLMKKMGIEKAVREVCVHEPGMQLIDREGRTKAFFKAAESGSGRQGLSSEFEVMRGDLVKILYDLTKEKDNVKHLFGTTIETFEQDDENVRDGKVHVTFQDGGNEDFDLVVGADGSGSKTRRIMLGPDAKDPRHRRGGYIGYFSIPSKPDDSKRGTLCHLPGTGVSRVIGTRKDCDEVTRIYMMTRGNNDGIDAAYKSNELQNLKKAWAELFEGGGWRSDEFMEALRTQPEADDLYCTPYEEVRLPKGGWSKGRVVLVGDSAQCDTASGFGTTWGLVGAYVLAGEIATALNTKSDNITASLVAAANSYEEKLRPISTSAQGGSDFFEDLTMPRSSWGIWILHTIARIAAWLKLDQMEGLDGKSAKWQLPEYPALAGDKKNA